MKLRSKAPANPSESYRYVRPYKLDYEWHQSLALHVRVMAKQSYWGQGAMQTEWLYPLPGLSALGSLATPSVFLDPKYPSIFSK